MTFLNFHDTHVYNMQAPNGHRECDADLLVITELGIHEKVTNLIG